MRWTRCSAIVAALAVLGGGSGRAAVGGWLKGQTHAHTGNSGDSRTPPADVVRWYEAHGFDFVVLTDHNFVTKLEGRSKLLAIPGAELTQNLRTCDPPPATPKLGCLLHVNALFATRAGPVTMPAPASLRRLDLYQAALDVSRELGAIAQLNHPNFSRAVDAPLLIALAKRGVVLLEVANQSFDVDNAGGDGTPSTEALWDEALTAGVDVWGVATDDAHHYADAGAARARGEQVYTGDRGWIMVRAKKTPADIRAALVRGDFYASTGVTLARLERRGDALEVEVEKEPVRFRFIGAGGKTLAESIGTRASFALAGARGGYVRVVVTDGHGRMALGQPIRVR